MPRNRTVQLYYVLSKAPEGWTQGVGYITEALMREKLFASSEATGNHTLGLMCGPPGLLNGVCVPGLTKMGYTKEELVLF